MKSLAYFPPKGVDHPLKKHGDVQLNSPVKPVKLQEPEKDVKATRKDDEMRIKESILVQLNTRVKSLGKLTLMISSFQLFKHCLQSLLHHKSYKSDISTRRRKLIFTGLENVGS